MKAKVGASLGLALLLAAGILAVTEALGMFSLSAVKADPGGIVVTRATTTPDTPGETATYTIAFRNPAELITGGDVYIKFAETIGVPSSIEKERIAIARDGGGVSNPQLDPQISVDNDGNTVIFFTVGDTDPSESGKQGLEERSGNTDNGSGGSHVLQFSRLAGITNSTVPDTESETWAWVQMSDDGVTYGNRYPIKVSRWLQLSKTSGVAGSMITVTGKAFSSGGTANLWLDRDRDGVKDADEADLGTSDANIANGAFTASVTISDDFNVGENYINARDGLGIAPMEMDTATPRLGAQKFTKIGSITASSASAPRGGTVTITLNDFGAGPGAQGHVVAITFGGAGATLPASGASYSGNAGEFEITVPSTTSLGTQTVIVASLEEEGPFVEVSRSTNIIITSGFTINVSPATAVANQSITVSGNGFKGGGTVAADTITVDGMTATHAEIDIDSGGRLIATFKVPAGMKTAGSKEVLVRDRSGRIGIAEIMVPAKAIALDPTESGRSSTVSVTGSGFSANTLVHITYNGDTLTTVTADSTGNLPAGARFTVPYGTGIPSSNTVTAEVGVPDTGSDRPATATHTVPSASISIDPASAASGQTISVTGFDFPGFIPVSTLTIGGIPVQPLAEASTGADGGFSASVLVPGLDLGTQEVVVIAGGTSANTALNVVTAPVSRAPKDVFADLIAQGALVEVLQLVRTSDTDATWFFYKPGEAFEGFNTYNIANSGDILQVNVSEQTTFQGKTLYSGWNSHHLN